MLPSQLHDTMQRDVGLRARAKSSHGEHHAARQISEQRFLEVVPTPSL